MALVRATKILDKFPQARETKAKLGKWGCLKPEPFCRSVETTHRMRLWNGGKVCKAVDFIAVLIFISLISESEHALMYQ